MKVAMLTMLGTALATALGCAVVDFEWGDDGRGTRDRVRSDASTPPPPIPPFCRPDARLEAAVRSVHDATESSMHELVTCGRMQVSIAQSLLVMVLASNRDLFHDPADFDRLAHSARLLGLTLEVDAAQRDDGAWVMPVSGLGAGSEFALSFADASGPIVDSPFEMDSYLVGVWVESALTLDEMLADLERQNLFTFTYDEQGPLARLLNDGAPVPNPFTLRFSLADVLAVVRGTDSTPDGPPPDWGPLLSLVDVEMTSSLEAVDERSGVTIAYAAGGLRATIAEVAAAGSVAFTVHHVSATDGEVMQTVSTADLRYAGNGELAGAITFDVTGPPAALRVIDDFGDGASYPNVRWECP